MPGPNMVTGQTNVNVNASREGGVLVPGAKNALDQFKYEIASELGMTNYQQIDKGQLSSRQNGFVGGNMVKKMIALAEQQMAGGNRPTV